MDDKLVDRAVLAVGWLVIALVVVWLNLANHPKFADELFLLAAALCFGAAWTIYARAGTSDRVAWLVLVACGFVGFWVMSREVGDLKSCVRARTPAAHCHTMLRDFRTSP